MNAFFEILSQIQFSYASFAALVTFAICIMLLLRSAPTARALNWHFTTEARIEGRNRRRAERVLCHWMLETWDAATSHRLRMRLVNLSSTGACLATTLPLRLGDSVCGQIVETPQGNIDVAGKVVWQKLTTGTTLYGIRFQTPSHL
jgi:hypothetical protein